MSLGNRWLIRLLAGLAVAAGFLLLLEGGARLLPVDRWERNNPNLSYPLFIPGEGPFAGQFVTNPHFRQTMSWQSFPQEKAPGVKRIFILGGSAALGWPGPLPTAFSGYLQRALGHDDPAKYEVINVAAMSYGSHRVLDLLADIVGFEPDLVIIWCGNNEYIENNAFSSYGRTAGMRGLQRILRHSYLYRSMRQGLGRLAPSLFAPSTSGDITDPRNTPQVRRGMLGRSAETDRKVLENYRANLREMALLIRQSGARGVFCTVPVNLSGWVPTNVPPAIAEQAAANQWGADRDSAVSLWKGGNYAEAVAGLHSLLAKSPEYAFAHYLLGDSYLHLGRVPEARAAFDRARDLDPRPIRALTAFEQAIREMASNEGMTLVDLEGAFAAASESGVPGLDLFLDYVHPNEAGHKLAAVAVLRESAGFLAPATALAQLEKRVAEDAWTQRNTYNQAEIFYTLGMTQFNNGNFDAAEQAYLRTLEIAPSFSEAAGNLAAIYEQRGNLPAARAYYQQALRNDPGSLQAVGLARVLYRLGEDGEARKLMDRILHQEIVDTKFFILAGYVEYAEGHYSTALEFFRKAVAAGVDDPEIQAKIVECSRRMAASGG